MKILKSFIVLATFAVSLQTFAAAIGCEPHRPCPPSNPPQVPTTPVKDCIPHVDCGPRPMPVPTPQQPPGSSIGCRPLVNCPGDQEPSLPGSGPRIPVEVELTVIGYAEIPSPRCDDEDLAKAMKIAKEKAINDAHFKLGKDTVMTQKFWFTQNCEQGMYANSAKGNSWIVQAFAKFEKKDI